MSTATLADRAVLRARVHLPAWGIPWAECTLTEEADLHGAVTLSIADFTLTATIMSGGPGPKGRSRFRLAAGAGGWGKTLRAWSYANDAGVKASQVIQDAARECGESLEAATLPDTRLGPGYVREEGPAARVLEDIAPSRWYVGTDGITRIGKRRATDAPPDLQIGGIDKAFGTIDIAADAIAALVPGVTIEGLEAVDVLHELEPGALRTSIWAAGIAATSRRLSGLRRIIEQIDPHRRYRGVFEYRVVTQEGERLNLQPIRASSGMPSLQRVYVRPGVSGARADVALGSRVLVTFLDGERARPVVVGFEDADGEGFMPNVLEIDAHQALELGATATITTLANGTLVQGVARFGDTAGPYAITTASTRVRCG